jgi:hypothetical protein
MNRVFVVNSDRNEVLHVMPNRYHQLQTTKSWDFIGLPLNARRNLKVESDVIVGLLDTGSWIFIFYIYILILNYFKLSFFLFLFLL